MEQNNYQVPIEALPHDIQTIVQRCIQGSGQDVRLAKQMQHDQRITPVQSTQTSQPKKLTRHPQKYAVDEALRHVHAAWRSKSKPIQQNMQFNAL